ncbi:MAG: IPT/TIG domain-containing protein, partial [Dehalococcoidia bacterium]|nr:IPT/TIG domain-containing protein [Dehalococcoidia bacterium]
MHTLTCRLVRQFAGIIVIAIMLLTAQLLPAERTSAAVSIAVSPTNGTVGTTVTVTGTVDANGNSFEIQWDGTVIASGAAPSGSTSVTTSFIVPNATAGAHTITLKDTVSLGSSSTTFTVVPSVTISPTSGPVGTQVTVTGKGFAASETGISLSYGTTAIDYAVIVDSTGSWSAQFNVPDSPSGTAHTITATRSSGTTVTSSQNFTVIPSLTISPT